MAEAALPHPFFADARVVNVRVYCDGFVPRSYRYDAPGRGDEWVRQADGTFSRRVLRYDRKRSYGHGPAAVGFSVRGGRLASN